MRILTTAFALLLVLVTTSAATSVRLLFAGSDGQPTNGVPSLSRPVSADATTEGSEIHLMLPSDGGIPWHHGEAIRGVFTLTPDLPPARLMLFLKTRDGYWFQALLPDRFMAGTNRWSVPFTSAAKRAWRPVGHHLAWNHRARLDPLFVGARLFFEPSGITCKGQCTFLEASLLPASGDLGAPPVPAAIHLSTARPACRSLLEASFELPDRYDNPFDPAEIDVTADITCPDGRSMTIPAFHGQDFYVEETATGGRLVPDGAPGWRLRYAPRSPGPHSLRIRATDRYGSATSAPVFFLAQAADGPDFITISRKSRMRFQAGTNDFFPIGHNIRSPFDSRYDSQYPWRARLPENYRIYKRYFAEMAEAGENMAEVWMCQWSLGLEWSKASPGYHGAGDYHLGNAWELDRVLEFAREEGIRINLVLNNHGRASLISDAEWNDHPYNELQGGFLPKRDPLQFFIDRRAIELQKRLCRYIAARWGWSPSIFAFELWSELDLCGNGKRKPRAHDAPDVIAWHKEIANYIRSLDPNKHLISTHLSGNYRNAKPALLEIPELDHCCIDAYHGAPSPLHIVRLLVETANYYRRFDKPVLVTEFGGASDGAGLSHIAAELHAALWTSLATTLSGTPFLWWWGLVDELDLYSEFTPVREFIQDAPYQDPDLRPVTLLLTPDDAQSGLGSGKEEGPPLQVAAASGTNLIAWLYRPSRLIEHYRGTPSTNAVRRRWNVEWGPVSNGIYRVVQCDTKTGKPVRIHDYRAIDSTRRTEGAGGIAPGGAVLRFPLEPFDMDCAVKISPR